jgi:hypothetical protein
MDVTHTRVKEWWNSLSPEAQALEHSKSRFPHIPFEVFRKYNALIKARWLVAMKEQHDAS